MREKEKGEEMKGIKVLLMAGGRGERFWPKSRASMPKQFLNLYGKDSLLQQAFSRALEITGETSDIYVITGKEYQALTSSQLPQLPKENIIVEPAGRNTAPAIGYASIVIEQRIKQDAAMIVMPSDHVVLNNTVFCQTINKAAEAADYFNSLVTIGMKPTRPEEGYGYIECGQPLLPEVYQVKRFVEKPPLQTALAFLKDGNYLWNAGIFVWKLSAFKNILAAYAPSLADKLSKIRQFLLEGNCEKAEEQFLDLEARSIDYALLERAREILVVPGEFGWDDVGTWAALERIFTKDENENIIQGEAEVLDSQGNIIENTLADKLIVAYRIDDMLIVNDKDVVLVTKKEASTDLKNVLAKLKDGKYKKLLR